MFKRGRAIFCLAVTPLGPADIAVVMIPGNGSDTQSVGTAETHTDFGGQLDIQDTYVNNLILLLLAVPPGSSSITQSS